MFCLNAVGRNLHPKSICRQLTRSISNNESWGHIVDKKNEVSRWRKLNDTIFEPTLDGQEKRPAVSAFAIVDFFTHWWNVEETVAKSYKTFSFVTYNFVFLILLQYVCHEKRDIWYSFKKLYIVSCFVRGLSVDDAVTQLSFVTSKGAKIVRDTILEAQELAVKQHNVEFKSNLWVGECFLSFVPTKICPSVLYF